MAKKKGEKFKREECGLACCEVPIRLVRSVKSKAKNSLQPIATQKKRKMGCG